MTVEIEAVEIINPGKKYQVIIGQANFSIFTTDDLFIRLKTAAPAIECAVAMNEAVPKLTRVTSTNDELEQLASKNAMAIGASHVFVIMMDKAFPINVLPQIKDHPAVCNIFVASANDMEAIVATTSLGKALLGVVDGTSITKIESADERAERRELTKKLGYSVPEK